MPARPENPNEQPAGPKERKNRHPDAFTGTGNIVPRHENGNGSEVFHAKFPDMAGMAPEKTDAAASTPGGFPLHPHPCLLRTRTGRHEGPGTTNQNRRKKAGFPPPSPLVGHLQATTPGSPPLVAMGHWSRSEERRLSLTLPRSGNPTRHGRSCPDLHVPLRPSDAGRPVT